MKKKLPINKPELLERIANIVSSTTDLSDLLRQVSKLVVDLLDGDSCLIYLYDEHNDFLVLSGTQNPMAGLLGKVKLKMGEGITGWAAQNGEVVNISQKAYEDPRFKSFSSLPEDKYESILSLPMFLKERLTGVINLQKKKSYKYDKEEISLLTTISKLFSGSIESARLSAETHRRKKQIETLALVSRLVVGPSYLDEILRLIVSITAESLGFKICSLMLLDDEKQTLSIAATQSLSEDYRNKPPLKIKESLSGRAVIEKKPVAFYDVRTEPEYKYPGIAKREGLVSLLSVPMMVKDKCIGVLNSYTHELHRFTETEIKILASVSNQAAIAIENTRLMEEATSSREELESRKLIEKAKGILMKEKGFGEEDAFKEMRKSAMDRRKTMKQIAEAILLSKDIKTN